MQKPSIVLLSVLLLLPEACVTLRIPVANRRVVSAAALATLVCPTASRARTPGSTDVDEAIAQVKDARAALRELSKDWDTYACINDEGMACNIDAARRVLGGVAPQRGDAAIAVAKQTPLYRIDGAFSSIRKYALDAEAGSWGANLDIESFVNTAEEITFAIKKADDSFYGVVFTMKGSTMISNSYKEAKNSVDRALRDFDTLLELLVDAKAPL